VLTGFGDSGIRALPNQRRKRGGFFERVGSDVLSGAESFGSAVVTDAAALHHALAAADPSNPRHFGHSDPSQLGQIGKQVAKSYYEDVRHPLRHPFSTALDAAMLASMGAGVGFKVAAAGRAAALVEEAGGTASAGRKAMLAACRYRLDHGR
jgi:hypothetical protein